jgi:dihydroxyacetone kinase
VSHPAAAGGGSGHEPTHAGLVGVGLLTASVAGEVFASPSAAAVLAAIRAVTGPPGCLIVINNYTGERQASERDLPSATPAVQAFLCCAVQASIFDTALQATGCISA